MLSSVLKSERAEKVNIVIIDTFVRLRELTKKHQDILQKIQELEHNFSKHDHQIKVLFEHLKSLLVEKEIQIHQERRRRIGYKINEDS
jgi:hypothetical protein